jgi:hypothetical protein
MMSGLTVDTLHKLAKLPLSRIDGRDAARSGLTAGAVLLVLSAASAAVTGLRERAGGS